MNRIVSSGDPSLFQYENIPDGSYDFIFVDGPSHILGGLNIKSGVDIDAIALANVLTKPCIVVSGRRATVECYVNNLSGYRFEKSDLFDENFEDGYRYFSIFTPYCD